MNIQVTLTEEEYENFKRWRDNYDNFNEKATLLKDCLYNLNENINKVQYEESPKNLSDLHRIISDCNMIEDFLTELLVYT